MRFRLVELFAAVFVCAFGCAALVRPTEWLSSLFFTFALGVLLAAVLCAIARRGNARYFWIGFAVTGIGYLWCVTSREAYEFAFDGGGSFATTRSLEWCYGRMHPNIGRGMGGGMFSISNAEDREVRLAQSEDPFGATETSQPTDNLTLVIGSSQVVVSDGSQIQFMQVGQSLCALLLAWIAGYFTYWVHSVARKSDV